MQRKSKGHLSRGLLLATLILLFCWRAVQASWIFALERVDVVGSETISQRQIEDIAGIWRGSQLLRLDLKTMEKKLLADPRIVSATVTRALPNRLCVAIEENIGLGVILYHDGFVEIDRNLRVVSIVQNFSQVNLPIVTGIELGRTVLGEVLLGEPVEAARQILSAIPVGVRPLISEVNVADPSRTYLYTTSGIKVKIGGTKDVQSRLVLLPAVLYAYEVREFDIHSVPSIDMSGHTPVFRGKLPD